MFFVRISPHYGEPAAAQPHGTIRSNVRTCVVRAATGYSVAHAYNEPLAHIRLARAIIHIFHKCRTYQWSVVSRILDH